MTDKTPNKSESSDSAESDDSPTAEMPRVPRSDKDPDASETKPIPSAVKTIGDVLSGDKSEDKDAKTADKTAGTADEAKTDAKPVAESKTPDDAKNSPGPHEGNDTKRGFAERMSAAVPSSLRNPKPVVKSTPGSNTGAGSNAGRSSGQTGAAKAPASAPTSTSPGSTDSVTAASRPITAGEYARTTNPSPSTTAVIPAVRDEPRPSTGAAAAATAASGRQASLKLVRVDPWSVTKVAFALSVALMIVAVVAMTILWIVLSFAGVWDQINSSVTTVLSDDSNSFDITDYLGLGRIVGLTLVIAAINVVITTAVATIGAYLYNLAAQLLGGVDITLAEDD